MSDLQRVGPVWGGSGSCPPFTSSLSGSQRVNDSHGRFTDAALAGRLFSAGAGATALSANTITLTATSTPIVGVWNPPNSGVNLVILQIALQVYINTLTTPVGCGPFRLAGGVSTGLLTLGVNAVNRRTLTLTGSIGKAFNGGIALTGLVPDLVVLEGIGDIQNTTIITHGTVTAVTEQFSVGGVYNVDGSIIVPPGGVLSVINTTSTTTCSVAARMLWEELPILP